MSRPYQSIGETRGIYRTSRELNKIRFPKSMCGLSFVDVGCAEGFFCVEAFKRGATKIVGIDLKSERIERAREFAHKTRAKIDYRIMSLQQLATTGKRFDVVLFLSVLHHIPFGKQRQTLKQLHGLCRKKLIIEVPTYSHTVQIQGKYLVSPSYFSAMAKDAGWTKVEYVGPNKAINRLVYHCRP